MASGSDDPALRVQWHDPDTVVLRQGKSVHFEAPFLFLLFGAERALLLDTGAEAEPDAFPLRTTVDHLVATWLERSQLAEPYPLVVAHTHAHDDHVARDRFLADRPSTTVIGHDLAAVGAILGRFDLGGRALEVVATPGHHETAVTVLDPATGWLLTGDTVYPGRLYIDDDVAFAASLDLLVDLAHDREVTAVVGCHIEMTTRPGIDHPVGTIEQPDEPPLPMSVEQLEAVNAAAHAAIGRPGRHVRDDFVLVNRTPAQVRPCGVASGGTTEGQADDEHWFVVDGRRWRRTDPELPGDVVRSLQSHLGSARATVGAASRRGDEDAVAAARRRVGIAKHGLGERGPKWWREPLDDRVGRARQALEELDAPPDAG